MKITTPKTDPKDKERPPNPILAEQERSEATGHDPNYHQTEANDLILPWFKTRSKWITWVPQLLTLVVICFQAYFVWQSNQITRDALAENTRQFSASLEQMRQQTTAAQNAAEAAQESATAASRSIEAARRQVSATEEQTNTAIDALRLDQRAWLGYENYGVQARESDASRWENREPKKGEQFRVRLFIQNVGRTPALNVRFMSARPTMIRVGATPDEPQEWSITRNNFVVFPNHDGLSQNTRSFSMSNQQFSMYSSRSREVFFWARLSYCDTTDKRHWTQIGVARLFEAREFSIRASSTSPDPGEVDHPDCQN